MNNEAKLLWSFLCKKGLRKIILNILKGDKILAVFNLMIAVGRITDVPILRRTSTGRSVANFTIALNRINKYNADKVVDFFDVIVWNKPAENCAKYLKKGSLVLVQGKMQKRKYENANGEKRFVVEIIADNIQFLEPLRKNKISTTDVGVEENFIDINDFEDVNENEYPFVD